MCSRNIIMAHDELCLNLVTGLFFGIFLIDLTINVDYHISKLIKH